MAEPICPYKDTILVLSFAAGHVPDDRDRSVNTIPTRVEYLVGNADVIARSLTHGSVAAVPAQLMLKCSRTQSGAIYIDSAIEHTLPLLTWDKMRME